MVKKIKYYSFLCIGIIIISLWTVYALGTWDTGYRINNGTADLSVEYWPSWGNTKLLTNSTGLDLFVWTQTDAELNSYCTSSISGTSCYGCTYWAWWDLHRWNTIDHDTGAGSIGHTQQWCLDWCRKILDWAKDTGQHICVRRPDGRCHLYRDDVINYEVQSGRTYRVMTCTN